MLVVCSCGKQLEVLDRLAGQWVRCPRCRQKFRAEAEAAVDVPVALDHPPSPDEIQAKEESEELPVALDGPPPAAVSPSRPASPLGDLAAAVSQTTDYKVGRPAENPRPARPPARAKTEASASQDADGEAHLAALAAAVGDTEVPSNGNRPAATAKARPAPRPRRAKPAVGVDEEDDAPVKKKRDPLPLILSGAVGALFLALLIGLIVAKTGGKEEQPRVAGNDQVEMQSTTAAETKAEHSSDFGFFGHIPANRTSQDYLREKQAREEKEKQNQPQ